MRPQYIAQSNARENTEPHLRTSMATRRAWARSALFAMWQNFALDPLELVPTPNIFFLTLTCQSPIVPTFSRVLFSWRNNALNSPRPRGKVLGGSSSINYMAYVRGTPSDYNSWAKGGATGWSYNDVKEYFLKSEDCRNIKRSPSVRTSS